MSKAKNWCFTLNNPVLDESDILYILSDAAYIVFQLEIGDNGTPHYQGYCSFTKRMTLPQVRSLLGTAHWEIARGTPSENKTYCTKSDTRVGDFCESGIFPEGSGHRTDLDRLHSALKDGLTQKEYASQYFSQFISRPNLVETWNLAQISPRDPSEAVTCILLIGPPGTGKSRAAHYYAKQFYGPNGFYGHTLGKWWDGYRGEQCVILDDFRGSSMSFTSFKHLVDRYPLRVEVKGASCNMAATHFYITTNQEPEKWWNQEVTAQEHSAVFRRIDTVLFFCTLNSFIPFPSYGHYKTWRDLPPQTLQAWVRPQIETIVYD